MLRNLKTGKFNDKSNKDTYEDLLVFGYHSKLFRNDEEALNIDLGRHLIPWAGDASTMIDRYDGRGHLQDLVGYDAEHFKQGWDSLTEEEKHMEALIDEERYLDLRTDIQEKLFYEEEEMKRSSENHPGAFSAIGYTYADSPTTNEPSPEDATNQSIEKSTDSPQDDSDPYEAHPSYLLPPSITLPETGKLHRVIEKTAAFIAAKGLQMEIVMKTKQKNNAHFSFLHYDHPLNAYYKHFVEVIRERRYVPCLAAAASAGVSKATDAENNEEVEKPLTSQEFLESVKCKLPSNQIANTSYALLLQNLKKHMPKPASPPPPPPQPPLPSQPPQLPLQPLPQQHQQPESVSSTDTCAQPPSTHLNLVPPPPDVKLVIDKLAASVARVGLDFETVLKQHNDPRFAFLDASHAWHNYYANRKRLLIEEKANARECPKTTASTAKVPSATAASTSSSTTPSNAKVASRDSNDKKKGTGTIKKEDKPRDDSKTVKSISFKLKKDELTSASSSSSLKAFSKLLDPDDDDDEEEGREVEERKADVGKGSSSLPLPHCRSSLDMAGVLEERKRKVERFVGMLRKNLSTGDAKSLGRSNGGGGVGGGGVEGGDVVGGGGGAKGFEGARASRRSPAESASNGVEEKEEREDGVDARDERVSFVVGPQNKEASDAHDDDDDHDGGKAQKLSKKKEFKHKKADHNSPKRKKHHKRSRSRSRSRSKRKSSRSRKHHSRRRSKSRSESFSRKSKKRSGSRGKDDDDNDDFKRKKLSKKHKKKRRHDDDDDDDVMVQKRERSISVSDGEIIPKKKKHHHHHHHHRHHSKHSPHKRKKEMVEEVVDLTLD